MLGRSKHMQEMIIRLQKMGYPLDEAEKIASAAEETQRDKRWKLINSIVNVGFIAVTIGWIVYLSAGYSIKTLLF
ncbi:MAG TPA: hypothetical protein PLG17_11875 [Thermodesulfobacteriota bacterium]|jgi:hypothetical protein|nr:hypothetical protein [Syntrophorhabdaceae bacterium]HQO79195.1 hypothetical protein [Thermodesulfobacteriota bacterium]